MAKYDVEKIRDDIEALMQSKLAAKLVAITTEKGDGITLDMPTKFIGTMEDEALIDSSNLYLYTFVDDTDTVSIGYEAAIPVTIGCLIVFAPDMGASPRDDDKRSKRYARAMLEVCNDAYKRPPFSITSSIKAKLVNYDGVDSNGNHIKIAGIAIDLVTTI